jgi:hypothetical protein
MMVPRRTQVVKPQTGRYAGFTHRFIHIIAPPLFDKLKNQLPGADETQLLTGNLLDIAHVAV